MGSLPWLPAVGDCVRRRASNLPAVLGQRSLGATLPPSEQFLPGGVDPHRGAPNENRSSFISRSGLRRRGSGARSVSARVACERGRGGGIAIALTALVLCPGSVEASASHRFLSPDERTSHCLPSR